LFGKSQRAIRPPGITKTRKNEDTKEYCQGARELLIAPDQAWALSKFLFLFSFLSVFSVPLWFNSFR